MRYLFIVFLFISSFISGQGIEPTSLQPSPYRGGFLKSVTPIVDEFTGDTTFIYVHTDSLGLRADSIYVRNDSILLRDGQGFVKMSAGWGLTVSSAGDSITYVSDTTKLATLFSVSGTNPRIPYFGTNSKLTTTDSLKWDVTNGEIDIKGRLNLGQTGFPSTILIGDESGKSNQGANNVFLGISSGYTNRFGTQNIGIGSSTLAFNVDGIRNVAIGHLSQYTSLGSFNTSIGYQSLAFGGGSGQFNTAIGVNAMENNAGGTSNDAIGYNTLRNNTTGSYNVAISGDALRSNQGGSLNVAIGNGSLYSNVGGGYNIGIGVNSLSANVGGYFNVGIGVNSLLSNVSGSGSTAIGLNSLYANVGGTGNTGIGNSVLRFNVSGSGNTAVGESALYNNLGNYNTAYGAGALVDNANYSGSVALGYQAGYSNAVSNRLYIENSNSSTPLIGGYFDDNRVGINTPIASIARTLHVTGEARITDLTTDTPTKIVGADNDGDLGEVTIGNGLTNTTGTLTANISGTQNRVAKFTSQYAVGNSEIYTVGDTLVGINQSSPQFHLDVTGKFRVTDRTGTAVTGAGFTSNGQLVSYSLDTSVATPNTYLSSGTSINITGMGTMADPYVIDNSSPENTTVKDSDHLDFSELSNDTITATIKPASIGATELASTTVSAGSYTLINGTVDADGRFTSVSNGTAVTSIATTSPITGGTITTTGTIGINDAQANASIKGAATYQTNDFNDNAAGLISIDYLNGQAASGSTKGFLNSTDWTTFNNKFNLPSLTNGSVIFSNGTTLAQDNSTFFWDNTNKRLGLWTNSPASVLHVNSSELTTLQRNSYNPVVNFKNGSSNGTGVQFSDLSTTNYLWYNQGTWNFGGSGAYVANKTTHIDGGVTIGANYDATAIPANSLAIQGSLRVNTTTGTPYANAAFDATGVLVSTTLTTGTVTSVGITAGSGISVSGSPITSSGNITVNNTGDLSNTNELQTLSFSSPNLSISGGNSVALPVLPSGSTPGNGIRWTGSAWEASTLMSIAANAAGTKYFNWNGGNSYLGGTGISTSGNVHLVAGGSGVSAARLMGQDASDALTGVTVGSGLSLSGGTLTATDASTSNEIQTLSHSAPTLSISSGNSITLTQQYGQMSSNGGCATVSTSYGTTVSGTAIGNNVTVSSTTITVPATGTYELNYSGYFILDPTASNVGVGMRVRKNGSSTVSVTIENIQGTASTEYRAMSKNVIVSLNSGDTLVLQPTKDAGTVNLCDYVMNIIRLN